MDPDTEALARRIEAHEAQMWAACVEAAGDQPRNPLKASLDRSGSTPLSTLAAFNFGAFNRVIALGVCSPATQSDVDAIKKFYRDHSQTRYLVEVTPVSRPDNIRELLGRAGLAPTDSRVSKSWRSLENIPEYPVDMVRRLSTDDREQWAAANLAGWGMPKLFAPWFYATLGQEHFQHYGIFDGDEIVSTGAIYFTDGLAWLGFAATRPQYRGRGYQLAMHAKRMREAEALGAELVHTETAAETPERPNPSFRNHMRLGYTHLYDKENFGPIEASPSP